MNDSPHPARLGSPPCPTNPVGEGTGFRRILLIAAMLAALMPAAVSAQEAAREDMPVDAATRERLVRFVEERIAQKYVFTDRAAEVARRLEDGRRSGRYERLATAAALTDALTADLRAASGDQHLQVVYSVEPRPIPPSGGEESAEDAGRRREEAAARNFGVYALSRLTGNVGYLELGRFEAPGMAGDAIAAAMTLLANTDALIIDLRHNGGGHAQTVALLASYFTEDATHLSTLHRRGGDDAQLWTQAHVAGPKYLGRPVYLLVSRRTFSGAEALAYDLQALGKAVVVGETTRGGANPGGFEQMDEHFAVFVPTARVESAVTHGNWEGTGVKPDLAVPAAEAVHAARRHALQKLIAERPDSPRAGMWREAMADMDAAANGAR